MRYPCTALESEWEGWVASCEPHEDTHISHKVFIKSFGKSQLPHKSVNVYLILVMVKGELTDLLGN